MLMNGHVPAGTKVPQAALLHAFKEAGWIDCGRVASAEHSTKKHIFAAADLERRHTKSDLRRMVEVVASDGDTVLKDD